MFDREELVKRLQYVGEFFLLVFLISMAAGVAIVWIGTIFIYAVKLVGLITGLI